ncbi:MAG: regulator of protease activity HflC (stomatin/prohibitin superfamily) [Sphingobacteriales bacterium]|jgi:regulator of protease activity HflC (stomatin/prohibitin superfamily)
MYDVKKLAPMAIAAFIGLYILGQLSCGTKVLEPGENGILFKPFSGGIETEVVYSSGFHFFAPWNKMIVYNCRMQEIEETMDVLSSNGLTITVDVSIRFFPQSANIGLLHQTVTNYIPDIIQPEVRSAVREVIGRYTPEELYSTKREEVQNAIFDKSKDILEKNNINLDALLMRSVKLPTQISEAIQKKLKQEQEALEYDFKIIKEEKERQRKKIEAKGIQEFQEIVTQGISEKLLRWKGIEATENLANSPNAKLVIVGGGKDGLPIILNNN